MTVYDAVTQIGASGAVKPQTPGLRPVARRQRTPPMPHPHAELTTIGFILQLYCIHIGNLPVKMLLSDKHYCGDYGNVFKGASALQAYKYSFYSLRALFGLQTILSQEYN